MRTNAPDEICVLIVEDSQSARSMIRTVQALYQMAGSERATAGLKGALNVLPFSSIQHDPLFEDKRPSSVLQLADYCAYVVKRTIRGDPKILRFAQPIRRLVIERLA